MASTSESNSIVSFDDEPDDVQTSEDEEEIEGVNGFENLSNTCYLNCIFQVLTRTTSLVDFYRNNKYKLLLTDANKTNLSDKFQKLVAIQSHQRGRDHKPKGDRRLDAYEHGGGHVQATGLSRDPDQVPRHTSNGAV